MKRLYHINTARCNAHSKDVVDWLCCCSQWSRPNQKVDLSEMGSFGEELSLDCRISWDIANASKIYMLNKYDFHACVICIHVILNNFWISMGWMREREGFRAWRPEYTTWKVQSEKTWFAHRVGCVSLKACSLISSDQEWRQDKNLLAGSIGIPTPECIYRFGSCLGFFPPNDLVPHLLPVAWIKVRFYFALGTAPDAILKTGKVFTPWLVEMGKRKKRTRKLESQAKS